MGKTTLRRILAAAGFGAAIALGAIGATPDAHADPTPVPGCDRAPWGFLGLTQVRLLCDGPLNPDGSWTRERAIVVPAHDVPFTCHTYGGNYYSTTSCDGGYYVDLRIISDETYPVTPETVLGDEPGWIVH